MRSKFSKTRLLGILGTSAVLATVLSSTALSSTAGAQTKAAHGAPLQLETIEGSGATDSGIYGFHGAEAAAAAINASGGVNGRPIQDTLCDGMGDANTYVACARNAASNTSVLATVLDNYFYGSLTLPITTAGGLALIGHRAFTPAENSSPDIFGTGASYLACITQASAMVAEGKTKIVLGYLAGATGAAEPALMNQYALAAHHLTLTGSVSVPATAVDFSSEAAAIIAMKPTAVVLTLTTNSLVGLVKSLRQLGYTGLINVTATTITTTQIKTLLGGQVGDFQAVSSFNYDSPGYKAFLKAMAKYQPGALINDATADGWLAVHIFAADAAQLKTVNRQTVLAGMKKVTNFTDGGMTLPINFSKAGPSDPAAFTSYHNPYILNYKYSNGGYVPANHPVAFTNYWTGKKVAATQN